MKFKTSILSVLCFFFAFYSAGAEEKLSGKVIQQKTIRLVYKSPVKAMESTPLNFVRLEIDPSVVPFWGFSSFSQNQDLQKGIIISAVKWNTTDSVVYDDNSVKPGFGYLYWVQSANGINVTEPVFLKFRDPEIWFSQEKVEEKIDQLQKKYPDLVVKLKLGETVNKNPIAGILCGNPKNAIMLIGYTHPGESGAELILNSIEKLLSDNKDLFQETGILAIPVLNIDSRNRLIEGHPEYLRHNSNGVDLNRNYPALWEKNPSNFKPGSGNYPGPQPASEPETQSVIAAIEKYSPRLVLDYHWMGALTGCDFLTVRTDTSVNKVTDLLAELYYKGYNYNETSYPPVKVSISNNPATTTRYCMGIKKIPALTIEGWSRSRQSPGLLRAEYGLTTRDDMKLYSEKHYRALLNVLEGMSSDVYLNLIKTL